MGAPMYHVMSRGDQRDDIFFGDADRYDFIKTLGKACLKTDWMVHAFCLMKNHHRRAWLRVDRLLHRVMKDGFASSDGARTTIAK
jgi:hypothetical protein